MSGLFDPEPETEADLEAARDVAQGANEDREHDPATVWCETCQHVHIARIPAVTWRCLDCGWGQWSDTAADHHVELAPGHRPYRVGHWIPDRIRDVNRQLKAATDQLAAVEALATEWEASAKATWSLLEAGAGAGRAALREAAENRDRAAALRTAINTPPQVADQA